MLFDSLNLGQVYVCGWSRLLKTLQYLVGSIYATVTIFPLEHSSLLHLIHASISPLIIVELVFEPTVVLIHNFEPRCKECIALIWHMDHVYHIKRLILLIVFIGGEIVSKSVLLCEDGRLWLIISKIIFGLPKWRGLHAGTSELHTLASIHNFVAVDDFTLILVNEVLIWAFSILIEIFTGGRHFMDERLFLLTTPSPTMSTRMIVLLNIDLILMVIFNWWFSLLLLNLKICRDATECVPRVVFRWYLNNLIRIWIR